jgi:hypothetical protein
MSLLGTRLLASVMVFGLSGSAFAQPKADAGSGPTSGSASTNDAGSGPLRALIPVPAQPLPTPPKTVPASPPVQSQPEARSQLRPLCPIRSSNGYPRQLREQRWLGRTNAPFGGRPSCARQHQMERETHVLKYRPRSRASASEGAVPRAFDLPLTLRHLQNLHPERFLKTNREPGSPGSDMAAGRRIIERIVIRPRCGATPAPCFGCYG